MQILERSWIVILLFLVSLLVGLTVPSAQKDIFFTLTYLFGGLLIFSFLWALLNVHWTKITRQTRSRRSQVGKYAEENFIVENTGPCQSFGWRCAITQNYPAIEQAALSAHCVHISSEAGR